MSMPGRNNGIRAYVNQALDRIEVAGPVTAAALHFEAMALLEAAEILTRRSERLEQERKRDAV